MAGAAKTAPWEGDASWNEVAARSRAAALRMAGRSLLLRVVAFAGVVGLARAVEPADLGAYAVFSSLIAFFSILGDVGLGAALVQRRAEPTNRELATAWTIQLLVAAAGIVVIWLAAPAVALAVPGLPGDAPWMLRLLSLGLLLASLRAVPSAMMERRLDFGPIALADVTQQIVFFGVAIPLALLGWHAWSFVAAGLAQVAVGTAIVSLRWRRRPTFGLDRQALRSLLAFGTHFQLSQVLIWLRDAPVPVVTAIVLGPAAAGAIQLAYRIAFTLASLDELLSRVAYPAMSRLQHDPALHRRALDRVTALTALVLVPIQCGTIAVAPVAVPALLGREWEPAVLPLEWLALGTLAWFPIRYIRQAVFAVGDSRRGLRIAFVATAVDLLPLVPALWLFGLPGVGAAFAGGSAVGLFAATRIARVHVTVSWGPVWRLAAAGLLATLAARAVPFAGDDVGAVAIDGAVFAATFAAGACLFERPTVRLAFGLLRTLRRERPVGNGSSDVEKGPLAEAGPGETETRFVLPREGD